MSEERNKTYEQEIRPLLLEMMALTKELNRVASNVKSKEANIVWNVKESKDSFELSLEGGYWLGKSDS